MKDNSVAKLGGICSILLGTSYVVSSITELLLPAAYTVDNDARVPIMFFEPNRDLFMTQWFVMAIGAVFALAVIPAVSARVRGVNEGWLRWTGMLATIGFVATILDNYWQIMLTPAASAAYATGSQAARIALQLPTAPQVVDQQGWLEFGAVGLWVLVVNLLALKIRAWPRSLAYLGLVAAAGYFLILVSSVVPALSRLETPVVAVIGAVAGPIWYAWMGVVLYRGEDQTLPEAVGFMVGP